MPRYLASDTRDAVGADASRCESASLILQKMVEVGDNTKREAIEAVCRAALCRRTAPMALPVTREFSLPLGGRMMVNMSGGVLENAGLCIHRLHNFPLIPGSSLKGIAGLAARSEWRQLMNRGRTQEANEIAERIARVFGFPTGNAAFDKGFVAQHPHAVASAGTAAFMDAVPADDRWRLMTDVLTPHGGNDYSNPIPSFFLAVDSGAEFRFGVRATRRARQGDVDDAVKWLTTALTEHGAGAKTVAGYGWFRGGHAESNSRTAELTLVTPAFLGGARHDDAADTCLRVPSLRGMLRWWWRSLYREFLPEDSLRELESILWGSTERSSEIVLRLESIDKPEVELFAFKDRFKPTREFQTAHAIMDPPRNTTPGVFYLSYGMDEMARGEKRQRYYMLPGAQWRLHISLRRAGEPVRVRLRASRRDVVLDPDSVLEQAWMALSLLCRLGGAGSKARKGFGCLSWPGAKDVTYCRETARKLGAMLGVHPPEVAAYSLSPAALLSEEVLVPWQDPWTVLDRLGLAVQDFAQSRKHRPEKAALGLPRKIHGPGLEPMPHQRTGHQRPENLMPALPQARQGNQTRFASPVWLHVEPRDTGFLVRISAFPSNLLTSASTSTETLNAYVRHVTTTLTNLAASPVHAVHGPAIRHHTSQQRPSQGPALRAGTSVFGVLQEQKTAKGGWRVDVQGLLGPIVNSREMPSELKAGDRVDLVVQCGEKHNPSFRWRMKA